MANPFLRSKLDNNICPVAVILLKSFPNRITLFIHSPFARQFHNIYTIGAFEGPTSSAVTTITAGTAATTAQTATAFSSPSSTSSTGVSSTHTPMREHLARNHQFSHMTQHQICNKFLNLTEEQRRICTSNEKIMEVIANGARLGREECQHQFRHSRWNCTAPQNSTSLYGAVTTIRGYPLEGALLLRLHIH